MFWRLRYKLSPRDLTEMFLIRGVEFSQETVRVWEAKLTPALIDHLRRRRVGRIGRSWDVDETYIKVRGHWCCFGRSTGPERGWTCGCARSVAKAFYRPSRAATGVKRSAFHRSPTPRARFEMDEACRKVLWRRG